MAEVTEEPQEPSSDSEIETRSLTQESPSVKGRNWKISCDLDDHEKEKVRKIIKKIKLALQQNSERCKKGKKSMILVCYHRRNKKKNENQSKEDEEVQESNSSPSTSLGPPGPCDLAVSVDTPEKALEKWSDV
ncbi:uncharacterized protein LOC110257823 [Sus scrofa]|uniref:uncharacterized protein LOC110257823 n=1 Tax=Sus scrofa TaxID=9823 RepID=UPI0001E88C63|nr:uncharacterized protein LOC110257823 [Sus scrofa]